MQLDQKIIRFQPQDRSHSIYIEDNAVRKQSHEEFPVPRSSEEREAERIRKERQRRWARTIRRHAVDQEVQRRYARANGLTRLQAGTAAVLVGMFLAAGVFFLRQEAAVLDTVQANNRLYARYLDLLHSNDVLDHSIQMSIDQKEIYDYVTKELGMAYPKKDQVIPYSRDQGGYVRQGEEIPEPSPDESR